MFKPVFKPLPRAVACVLIFLLFLGCKPEPEGDVLIETPYGDIVINLYRDTPKHSYNFAKLAKRGYYDGTTFHRVIEGFMIQGGDSKTKADSSAHEAEPPNIPAEILPNHFHKPGALAAARMGDQQNPLRLSSGSQFYIVHGHTYNGTELSQIEQGINLSNERAGTAVTFLNDPANRAWQDSVQKALMAMQQQGIQPDSQLFQSIQQEEIRRAEQAYARYVASADTFVFTDSQRTIYTSQGGAPGLDAQYTVFGEVVQGLQIVDQIAKVAVTGPAQNPSPVQPVYIKVKLLMSDAELEALREAAEKE